MKLSSDRIVIPLILAFYVGFLVSSGALMSIAETMWKQISTAASTISSPLGIFYLIAGSAILCYIVGLRKIRRNKNETV